jgi:hypothetical protein
MKIAALIAAALLALGVAAPADAAKAPTPSTSWGCGGRPC